MRSHALVVAALGCAFLPAQLYQGIDVLLPIRRSTLQGFPNVTWTYHAPFQVNAMAALDDGRTLVIATGAFTTTLHRSVDGGTPGTGLRAGIDVHGLGYGRDALWGFSNFGSPMGIYRIDPSNGNATLAVDTSGPGFRFFGLDYNPIDGLLYGYTEYGNPTGLYAIDPASGAMRFVAPSIPAANTQGRGLAIGNHTVYLTATRGQDGIPVHAWDLRQGTNGSWVPFGIPFPTANATGGSAFAEVRQPDLGYRGEGAVTISCVGGELRTGGAATLRIHSALPRSTAWVIGATMMTPTFVPQLNATVVAPLGSAAPVPLDARGWLELPLQGGGGPATFYLQVIVPDLGTPSTWAVSNALRVDLLP